MINKKRVDESDDDAFRTLERFLELGVKIVKLWSAPRAASGACSSTPRRIEALKRGQPACLVMVHVA